MVSYQGASASGKEIVILFIAGAGLIIVFYMLAKREAESAIGSIGKGVSDAVKGVSDAIVSAVPKITTIEEGVSAMTLQHIESTTGQTLTEVMRESTGNASYENIPQTLPARIQIAIAGMQASGNKQNIQYIYNQLSYEDQEVMEIRKAYVQAMVQAGIWDYTTPHGTSMAEMTLWR